MGAQDRLTGTYIEPALPSGTADLNCRAFVHLNGRSRSFASVTDIFMYCLKTARYEFQPSNPSNAEPQNGLAATDRGWRIVKNPNRNAAPGAESGPWQNLARNNIPKPSSFVAKAVTKIPLNPAKAARGRYGGARTEQLLLGR